MTELQSGTQSGEGGKVLISDEILAVIAAKAAAEVEGVVSHEGKAAAVKKNMPKGVNVATNGQQVRLALALSVKMGVKLHDTSKEVQDRVKTAIETMTGLTVSEVNIKIAAVVAEKGK